jgi:hypothetical protein
MAKEKKNIIEVAKMYVEAGYSIIPVSPVTKQPTIRSWSIYQRTPMTLKEVDQYFTLNDSIAILCGGESRVFCLDADMKYDLSGDMWERYKKEIPRKILTKMMCQSSQNKGYHLVCKVPTSRLFGNEKLASRYTTPYEKHTTYMAAFNKPSTRDKALNIALQDKSRVLFETRSGKPDAAGGYFLIAPSKGYKIIYGKIQEITEEEYDTLIEVTRQFNEVVVEERPFKTSDYQVKWEVSPFDHYSKEGDVVTLLVKHGWDIVYSSSSVVRFKRPGSPLSSSSALFDCDTRIFNVFSTSTSFDVSKGYNPAGVFAHLEANDDSSLAYKKLIELGFGKK